VRIDRGLFYHLHPAFRQMFACVRTPAYGDCFYEALSIVFLGNVKYMELVRLYTAFLLIRYRDAFYSAFHAMGFRTDFLKSDPMHFFTISAFTPSTHVTRSLELNSGKGWENYSSSFC
jgi:hypothetical protein